MNVRQGTDIADVRRIRSSIERNGNRFLNQIFTPEERAYCESKRMKYEHYAARFAAKEAVMKALGLDRKDRHRFLEIEIRRHATGRPLIDLSSSMKRRLDLPKKYKIELSMAHERQYAVATALLVLP